MVEDSATRTVPIKLDVDGSAADLLHQTTDYFLDAANYVVDAAWEPDWKITSKQTSTISRTTTFEMTHRSRPTSCKLHETEPQKPSKVSSNAGNKARKPRNPTSRRDSPATTLEPSPSTTTTAHSPR